MSNSTENALTKSLLNAIRLQRHIGTRVFISTQEPTISPAIIDLCSMTVVHRITRFSSPEWLNCLRLHVAALHNSRSNLVKDDDSMKEDAFSEIVRLRVGEALLFAPEAMIGNGSDHHDTGRSLPEGRLTEHGAINGDSNDDVKGKGKENGGINGQRLRKLGTDYIKIRVRQRLTNDGGKSVLAA